MSLTIEIMGTVEAGVLASAPATLTIELGTPGPAATIAVGTTTTLAPGSSATVNNSGSSSAATFNFGIPQGTAGTAGATGATGATGAGVATGGTTGQVLSKVSGTNFDTTWTTPSASATWGSITGTISSQTDLQEILDDKLNLSGGALTGSITMAGVTIDSEMSSDYFGIELSADHTQNAYLEYNKLTVSQSGYFVTAEPALLKVFESVNNLGVSIAHDSIAIQHIDTPNVTGYFTNEYIGFEDLGGSPHSTFIEHDVITVQDGSGMTQMRATGLTFPDSTTQSTAANPFNGGTVTAPIIVDESATSGFTSTLSGAQLNFDGTGCYISAEETTTWGLSVSNCPAINFSDSTTQSTAAVSFTGGTLGSIVAVAGSGGTASLGTDSGGSISVTDLSATTTTKVTYSGITFSDSTVQSTAAVAPPSADVLTANAIASNINYISGSSGTWVGSGLPTIASLIGWGVYNVTDGLIAYSYSSGSTFYLASAISTSNDTVQVSGSNSSFYVA